MGQWHSVANKDDIKPGQGKHVSLEGNVLALFNIDGKIYAIDDACSHAGGSLAEGAIAGTVVTCPWHGATFDIITGAALSNPAYEGVKSYSVKIEGDDVLIEI